MLVDTNHPCRFPVPALPAAVRRTVAAVLLLLLPAVLPAAATPSVYRWVDAAGVVHYADHPGSPDASPLRQDGGLLSVVETTGLARKLPPNPFVTEELRWQMQGRDAQRRETEREIAEKERRCAALRTQLDAANAEKLRAQARKLERQWFAGCR